jgi:hypothetical protein
MIKMKERKFSQVFWINVNILLQRGTNNGGCPYISPDF